MIPLKLLNFQECKLSLASLKHCKVFTINHSFDIFSLFQLASSTLDASAKIYAGRVDAIHSDAYKVLTGLGRSNVAMPKDSGMLSMIQLSFLLV